MKYPTGISKCTNYSDDYTCIACDSLYYLSGNECLAVPAENLINNCRYYNADKTCIQCNTNYVLNGN